MSQYRKKPVVIEAVQLSVDSLFIGVNPLWLQKALATEEITRNEKPGGGYFIKTLEGVMYAAPGDYIICGIKGELYPCKPDIFAMTYDKVET